ncbi:unnamed protein product [Candida verbasci]|uniref:Enoyl reductase (ER) domain-containing protein n=1 Tax=Candida verbasci TaxID=1227364 RepID=A0A9W4X8M2_9ASCO|nr:unnamed protein product [Candida verbasci]
MTLPQTLTYKAYGYKNNRSPIQEFERSINLVPSNGDYIAPKDKVLIKIAYAALNPVDIKIYSLIYSILNLYSSNFGFGADFSGEVVSVGENVVDYKVGDLVQGVYHSLKAGTVSEYILLDPKKTYIAKKADKIDLAHSAAWPLVLGTAITMIKDLDLKDKKVLILGGATSVGRNLIQIAKIEQAREIIASCSGKSEELVKKLGADSIIDYKKHSNMLNPVLESAKSGKFDIILDCWGGDELFSSMKYILDGTYNTVVGDSIGNSKISLLKSVKSPIRQIASTFGLLPYKYNLLFLNHSSSGPGSVVELARDYLSTGKIEIFIDHIYN